MIIKSEEKQAMKQPQLFAMASETDPVSPIGSKIVVNVKIEAMAKKSKIIMPTLSLEYISFLNAVKYNMNLTLI